MKKREYKILLKLMMVEAAHYKTDVNRVLADSRETSKNWMKSYNVVLEDNERLVADIETLEAEIGSAHPKEPDERDSLIDDLRGNPHRLHESFADCRAERDATIRKQQAVIAGLKDDIAEAKEQNDDQ